MAIRLPLPLASLLQPDAYPHAVAGVELVETHISWVFLTGELAYKIKRPVRYDFVDLRAAEQRAFFCREELRLNRRFAPELYLDVCTVTLEGGRARIGGTGEVIDHAVRMRQFRREEELVVLLTRGALAPAELATFARELAELHAQLPPADAAQHWGRPEDVQALLQRNLVECLQAAAEIGVAGAACGLREPYHARLEAARPWLDARRGSGKVRECHGDLHAGNIVRYGGRLRAFDCLEFEPAFRWIDVAEELASLFMDLLARQCGAHAYAFLNGYLFQSGDYPACRGLRLYGAHRALVRAKVAALRALDAAGEDARVSSRAEHHRYVACARALLQPAPPRLILTCGVSGSGKTWLAERLALELGAVHVRSDVERKRLAGLSERQRSAAGLDEGAYSAQMTEQVYARLRECAAEALGGGFPVIVDATFQQRAERARFRALAEDCSAALDVILCQAPQPVLQARIAERRRTQADASEADERVLHLQQARFDPILPAEKLAVIDADTTQANVVAQVSSRVGTIPNGAPDDRG